MRYSSSRNSSAVVKYLCVLTAVILLGACSDATTPTSGDLNRRLSPLNDLATKSGNHVFHGAKGELVIDHSSRLLFNEAGQAVRISEEALPQMENAFDQIDKLDTFFSNLKSNGQYQKCLALAKHSSRRITLAVVGKSPPLGNFNSPIPNSLRASVVGSAGLGMRGDVVEPGSCEDWANVLNDYQSQYDNLHIDYEQMIIDAAKQGVVVTFGVVGGITGWEVSIPTIVGALVTRMFNAWDTLSTLTVEIDFARGMLTAQGCITPLPTVIITASSGSDPVSSCYMLIITTRMSYDGGETWYVSSVRYETWCSS